ncbi:MAG: hypothetical protein U0T84_02110 [Chitinophagales bacterium]
MKRLIPLLKAFGLVVLILAGIVFVLWLIGVLNIERGPNFEQTPRYHYQTRSARTAVMAALSSRGVDTTVYVNQHLLLNYWDRGCGHCIAELPVIQRIHDTFQGRLRVLSFFSSDSILAKRLFEERHLRPTYPIYYGYTGARTVMRKICAVNGYAIDTTVDAVPFNCIISSEGKILVVYPGEITLKDLPTIDSLIR